MPPLRGAAPSPPRRPPHPPPSAPPLYPTLTMADLVPVEIGGPVSSPTAAGEDTVGPPPSEDVLLRVPGAQLHLIDRSRSHPLAAGDISLLRIRSGDTSLAAIALLDPVQWPLARDVAAVKLDPCHHSFSLTVPASADDPSPDPLHYGLTLAHPDARLDGLLAAYPAGDDGLVVEAAYGVKLVADGRVADLESEAFDLIALPGGMPGSVNLRDCKALEKMVKNHAENGGLYGAICAAPSVTLAYWGMLKGLKATCYPSFMEKFTTEVIPVNSRVVVDRNAVTSQGPGTAIEFALALVERLYGKEKMEEVAGPLYVRPQHGVEYSIEELNSFEWKCSDTPQVLVPVANGSEEMEAINLIDVLRRAGANVTVASVEENLQILTRRHKFNLIADVMLDEAAEMQFDLIVMPGGLQGAQKFASTKKLVDLLKKHVESNKPYGAICASPAHVLEPHGLLKGKKATASPPMSHLLKDQSACEHRVVVDGNLITSQAPGTATEFALAIVEKLLGRDKAISIARELIFM